MVVSHLTRGLALALPLVIALPAAAITIRHDRTQAEYVTHGNQYPVGMMSMPGWMGSGTLIASQWVLTAAHVAETGDPAGSFIINGNTYNFTAANIFSRAGWTLGNGLDMSLIRLSSPVVGVTPVQIYRWNDEAGQNCSVVGFGGSGTGISGVNIGAGSRRGGTNIVNNATTVLTTDMDDPTTDPTATNLEMCAVPGDSGGGLFIQRTGTWYVAGVTSYISGGGDPWGRYGDGNGYARVSSSQQWIDSVMAVPEPGTMALASLGLLVLRRRRRNA